MKRVLLYLLVALVMAGCTTKEDFVLFHDTNISTPEAKKNVLDLSSAPRYEYKIQPHDRISITMYNHPELGTTSVASQKQDVRGVLVNSNGYDRLPLVKSIHVAGLSQTAAQKKIEKAYGAYLEDADGEEEIAVFHCYVDAVFRGTDTNIVQVTHVFLIDNFSTKISTGDIYGAMEVVRADSDGIVLANRVMPTIIDPGSRQMVMGNMYLRTADDETAIRFYPAAEYTIGRVEPPGYPDPDV